MEDSGYERGPIRRFEEWGPPPQGTGRGEGLLVLFLAIALLLIIGLAIVGSVALLDLSWRIAAYVTSAFPVVMILRGAWSAYLVAVGRRERTSIGHAWRRMIYGSGVLAVLALLWSGITVIIRVD